MALKKLEAEKKLGVSASKSRQANMAISYCTILLTEYIWHHLLITVSKNFFIAFSSCYPAAPMQLRETTLNPAPFCAT